MSEPQQSADLDPEALAMLAMYRNVDRPADEVKSRVWSRLQSSAAPVSVAGAPSRGPMPWVALGAALAAGLVLAIVGIRGAVLTEEPALDPARPEANLQHETRESGGEAQHKQPTPARRLGAPHEAAPPQSAPPPAPPPEAVVPTAHPPPPTPRRRHGKTAPPQVPTVSETLPEETRLLRKARTALASASTDRALALLRTHAQKFPGGVLAEERDALEAVALCTAGRATGPRRAKAFARRYPGSALLGRVTTACGARDKIPPTP